MKNIIKYFKSCLEPSRSLFINFYLDDDSFIFNYELNPPIYKFIISDFYFNFIYLYVKDRTDFDIDNFNPGNSITETIDIEKHFSFSFEYELEEYKIFKLKEKILKI